MFLLKTQSCGVKYTNYVVLLGEPWRATPEEGRTKDHIVFYKGVRDLSTGTEPFVQVALPEVHLAQRGGCVREEGMNEWSLAWHDGIILASTRLTGPAKKNLRKAHQQWHLFPRKQSPQEERC